jgi:hypothetical protein
MTQILRNADFFGMNNKFSFNLRKSAFENLRHLRANLVSNL